MKKPLTYKICISITSAIAKLYRPIYINEKVIPNEGGALLAGNHIHDFDGFLVISAIKKRYVRFLVKIELTKGFLGPFFKGAGMIPVDRAKKHTGVTQIGIDVLKNDNLLSLFPEGTVNETNELILPFKLGAIKMAYESKKPIIPFAITGKFKLFKKGLKLEFGEPYYVKSSDFEKENKILMDKVTKLILKEK